MLQVIPHDEGFQREIEAAILHENATAKDRVIARLREREFKKLVEVMFDCARRIEQGDTESSVEYLRNMAKRADAFVRVICEYPNAPAKPADGAT
jgi:hypothetical protein